MYKNNIMYKVNYMSKVNLLLHNIVDNSMIYNKHETTIIKYQRYVSDFRNKKIKIHNIL